MWLASGQSIPTISSLVLAQLALTAPIITMTFHKIIFVQVCKYNIIPYFWKVKAKKYHNERLEN